MGNYNKKQVVMKHKASLPSLKPCGNTKQRNPYLASHSLLSDTLSLKGKEHLDAAAKVTISHKVRLFPEISE